MILCDSHFLLYSDLRLLKEVEDLVASNPQEALKCLKIETPDLMLKTKKLLGFILQPNLWQGGHTISNSPNIH